MAAPGAKAEDTDLLKVAKDKWEGPTQLKTAATTPRPLGGEDEGEAEETLQLIIDVL